MLNSDFLNMFVLRESVNFQSKKHNNRYERCSKDFKKE